MKTTAFLFFLAVIWMQTALAQDTIYKTNKEVIIAKVTEIGTEEIKYKMPEYPDGPVIAIDKRDIWKIVFASGMTQLFQEEMYDVRSYANQRKNAVKIDFLSLAFYKLTFGYERSIKPGVSYETTLGIIGVGHNPDETRSSGGVFIRAGMKFIKSPDFYLKGMRYAHILKGAYVKPEIFVGSYHEKRLSDNYNYYFGTSSSTYTPEYTVTFGGIHLAFGKQWVFDNVFLVDNFVSLGYAFDNIPDGNSYNYLTETNLYGTQKFSSESPFSISAGLKIGVLF